MRVLLDECLPRRLRRELAGYDASTVPEMGWASKRNGELLALASSRFDIFLTVDRNLAYQQDVSDFNIAVVVVVARSNNIDELRPLVPQVLGGLRNGEAACSHDGRSLRPTSRMSYLKSILAAVGFAAGFWWQFRRAPR